LLLGKVEAVQRAIIPVVVVQLMVVAATELQVTPLAAAVVDIQAYSKRL
jgi:hypothetical protein